MPAAHAGRPMLFNYCSLVIAASLVLGGGTRAGFLGDAVLQLTAIGLLALVLWILSDKAEDLRIPRRLFFLVSASATLLAVSQLLPLPFDYWRAGAAFLPPPAPESPPVFPSPHTLSIAPQATWAAAVSLIVPLAIFGAVLCLDLRARLRLCTLVTLAGAFSLVLGFLQLAQGPDSALRLYEFTNTSDAVGFFANRNHFAAFLNVILVLSAFWLIALANPVFGQARAGGTRSFLWVGLAGILLVADVSGLTASRSRAGIAAGMAVIAIVVLWISGHLRRKRGALRRFSGNGQPLILAAVIFAVLFAVQFSLGNIVSRLHEDSSDRLRPALNRAMMALIPKALPLGTGLGSFVPVYAAAEREEDVFPGYANRAHNDLAEFILEAGLPGVTILVVFLVWLLRRCRDVWFRAQWEADGMGVLLQRASTLILSALIAHSVVDYPLRTTAMSAVFAMFSAVLAAPSQGGISPIKKSRSNARRDKPEKSAPLEIWKPDTGWPEGWQR